jgi:molecular chaperone GrpE
LEKLGNKFIVNKNMSKDMDQDNINDNQPQIVELLKENEELKVQVRELENNWKRALADYRNFQKRTDEEKQNYIDFATASLVLRFLGVLDNLEMLNKHIDDIGLKMIVKEFKSVLTDEGLVEIDTQGKEFDANEMEAVDTVSGEKNLVVETIRTGYRLKNKLVRPARVKVGNGEAKKEE